MKKFSKTLMLAVISVLVLSMVLVGCKDEKEELLPLPITGIEVTMTQTTLTPGRYEVTARCLPANSQYQEFTAKLVGNPLGVGLEQDETTKKFYLNIGSTATDGAKVSIKVNSTYEKRVSATKEFALSIPEPEFTMISTEEQLRAMKDDLGGFYRLANDITLTSDWEQIGDADAELSDGSIDKAENPFRGILDGAGHVIRGLKMIDVSSTTGYNRGFFGQLADTAKVENIGFEGTKMEFRGWSGVIAAHNFGIVRNVYTNVPLTVDGGCAGALIGVNNNLIEYSYALGRTISTSTNEDKAGVIGVANSIHTACFGDRDTTELNYFAGFRSHNTNEDWNVNFLLSTERMQTAATFIDAGWDTDIWDIQDIEYPKLKVKA